MGRERKEQGKALPAIEVSLFCQQAAMIMKSGIPLYDGMELLYQNYKETEYASAFQKIYEGVRDGGTLYEGVKAAGYFPDYMVHMIHVGEMAGKLDDVLEALAAHYEREDRLKSSVRSAILYPLILTLMLAVVIGILTARVLPVFTEVFESMGTGLSATSAALLSGGVLLGRIALVAAAVLLVGALLLFLLWKTGRKEQIIQWASGMFPRIRHLLEKQTAQRFADVISMVLSSGYSLENALDMIPEVLPDERSAAKARLCKKTMEECGDFAQSIKKAGLFDPLYQKMIRVGVQAGQTDQVMARLSHIYEGEVEDGIQAMVSWIEPALVAVLTIVIGGILLSVMLPLVSIMASIG